MAVPVQLFWLLARVSRQVNLPRLAQKMYGTVLKACHAVLAGLD